MNRLFVRMFMGPKLSKDSLHFLFDRNITEDMRDRIRTMQDVLFTAAVQICLRNPIMLDLKHLGDYDIHWVICNLDRRDTTEWKQFGIPDELVMKFWNFIKLQG